MSHYWLVQFIPFINWNLHILVSTNNFDLNFIQCIIIINNLYHIASQTGRKNIILDLLHV